MSIINSFKLEEYLTQYEFNAPYLLCCSDAESFKLHDIIAWANTYDKLLWDNLSLGYTETYGLPALRFQIALSLYTGLQQDNILCFAGAAEGIYSTLHYLCNPGEEIIVLTPCYQALLEIPRSRGANVIELALLPEEDWRINLATIKAVITNKTKLIVINFPHNPSGQVISHHELDELVKLCRMHNIWLFADEVYHGLGNPELGWSKPASLVYEKAISLGVMSKAFGMPGLRIGWIASQNISVLHEIKQLKNYLSICNSAPAEIISLIALKHKDKILARNNEIVNSNLVLLDQFMLEYQNNFSWVRPQGGCTGFVKYNGREDIEKFCTRLVNEQGVLLLPGTVYDYPESYFRIGFGRKNMLQSLDRLKAFIYNQLI